MPELRYMQAKDLDKFIEDHLLPDTTFRLQVRRAIDIICSFLKERCFRYESHPVRVSKVVKGGSSGKGTALKGRSDADLVVFLNNLKSFEEQLNLRGMFIKEIKRQLEACQRERKFEVIFEIHGNWLSRWLNPRVLSFRLMSPKVNEWVNFDVLPAYDALGHVFSYYKPNPQIYVRLIKECSTGGEFSTCFTELQRDFLKRRPTKLKNLIRLVKYWYQECLERIGKPLPPQYALELLTVYAWERGSYETDFNTAQGFRTVLELVIEHKQLCIFWTEYYDFENPIIAEYLRKQLRTRRPVILDPADPTGNLGAVNQGRWSGLASEAAYWLQSPCFKNPDGSPVPSWDVLTRHLPGTLRSTGKEKLDVHHPLNTA
ncbi:2'-5'-oligoadenylate synthase 1 [Orycteropus afer afer]|uniref:2'-5'-oligoadenylate synthase 1 n=1 Tax=Orycteropus afer afer TaxID=1230840 RepID=A0AC54Z5H6_ORYAF|nr:2'-5'-oligoadenylate synthase 1 [Orycteropus afer afer]